MIISEKLSEHPQWLFAIVLLAITGIGLIGTANHPNMHMTSDELMESKKSARLLFYLRVHNTWLCSVRCRYGLR